MHSGMAESIEGHILKVSGQILESPQKWLTLHCQKEQAICNTRLVDNTGQQILTKGFKQTSK